MARDDRRDHHVSLDPVRRLTHPAVRAELLRHEICHLGEPVCVTDRRDGPWGRHHDAVDGDPATGLLDGHADRDTLTVDRGRFCASRSEVTPRARRLSPRITSTDAGTSCGASGILVATTSTAGMPTAGRCGWPCPSTRDAAPKSEAAMHSTRAVLFTIRLVPLE